MIICISVSLNNEYKYYVASTILFKVIQVFDNLSVNTEDLLLFQWLGCASFDIGDTSCEDIHSNNRKPRSTNTIQKDNRDQIRKSGSDKLDEGDEQVHILIAEAEKELLVLFRDYLSSLGVKSDAVDRGDEALNHIFEMENEEKTYDVIIVDTHLDNPSGLDVAKKIHSEKPNQKIVLITTTPRENLPKDCLKMAGIEDRHILTMPFRLSTLGSAVKN